MQAFTDARTPRTPDELWLTEHPPVYTLGLAGRREHCCATTASRCVKVDRGGQVTYHGPGQLVAYLLVDLRRARLGVREMVRRLEGAVIDMARSASASPRTASRRRRACTSRATARSEDRGARTQGAQRLHVSRRSRSTSRWTSRRSPTSIPAAIPGLAVTQLARSRRRAHRRRRPGASSRRILAPARRRRAVSCERDDDADDVASAAAPHRVQRAPASSTRATARPRASRSRSSRPRRCASPTGSACARRRRRASSRSSRSCASTTCTRCARKRRARTSASASARARRRS